MGQIFIKGGYALNGEICIQGSKNSVLPILAATLLARGEVEICHCPRLRDVETSIDILRSLGCKAVWEGENLVINTNILNDCTISDTLMREMRSSVIFLGAALSRLQKAVCSMPGGCELGSRPIDMHLAGLRMLGAEIQEDGGKLYCTASRLRGCEIILSTPSVGATENLMLAGCGAEGITTISNAAREPEIEDLQNFLNACGGRVSGAGSNSITVEGGHAFHGCTYTVIPDRIVASTYLCATAAAGGSIFLRGASECHLSSITSILRKSGCIIKADTAGLSCTSQGKLKAPDMIRTAPYPGFPTDAQAVFMAALIKSSGSVIFEENLFDNRYRHVDELRRMGANIRVSGRLAVVNGVKMLHGAAVECTDLRGGAALCVAALTADGETQIGNIFHIDRGYEDITRDLAALGADITRKDAEK